MIQLKKPGLSVSILGNTMISIAIWKKHARVSFLNTSKQQWVSCSKFLSAPVCSTLNYKPFSKPKYLRSIYVFYFQSQSKLFPLFFNRNLTFPFQNQSHIMLQFLVRQSLMLMTTQTPSNSHSVKNFSCLLHFLISSLTRSFWIRLRTDYVKSLGDAIYTLLNFANLSPRQLTQNSYYKGYFPVMRVFFSSEHVNSFNDAY